MYPSPMSHLSSKKWFLIILCVVLIFSVSITLLLLPQKPTGEALAALESTSTVTVKGKPWLSFNPADSAPTTGFIFYVGSKVRPESYSVLMQGIAAEDYLVVVPKMPANMAIFDWKVAGQIMDEYSGIENWAIGGHSLGGVMAARYVKDNPEELDGLIFWASFPAQSFNLSDRDINVSSIYGSLDGLASPEEVMASKPLLPADTTWVELIGGNHAQFGGYGEQEGDLPAALLSRDQQKQVVDATVALLESINQ